MLTSRLQDPNLRRRGGDLSIPLDNAACSTRSALHRSGHRFALTRYFPASAILPTSSVTIHWLAA